MSLDKSQRRAAAWLIAVLLLTPTARAFAQGQGGVSLVRDTEIEEILHQDGDPIFVAAGLDPKSVQIHLHLDHRFNQ